MCTIAKTAEQVKLLDYRDSGRLLYKVSAYYIHRTNTRFLFYKDTVIMLTVRRKSRDYVGCK